MRFLENFRAGFAAQRHPMEQERPNKRPFDDEWPEGDETELPEALRILTEENERLDAQLAEANSSLTDAHGANDRLAAQLRELRGELVEARDECGRLSSENARLRVALEENSEDGLAGDTTKVAERVWRIFARQLHPDKAEPDETGAQALERVFKALRADIDRLKKSRVS